MFDLKLHAALFSLTRNTTSKTCQLQKKGEKKEKIPAVSKWCLLGGTDFSSVTAALSFPAPVSAPWCLGRQFTS